jgi:excisionase family DNA binding protein
MTDQTSIYTLGDLEKKLKIGVRTLREYIKKGDLEASKIGRAYYVTEPKVMAFIEARR